MDSLTNNVAILTAAGSGTRLGGAVKKQFRDLGGIPVFIRSLSVLMNSPVIGAVLITAPEEDIELCGHLINQYLEFPLKPYRIIAGGAERQDSIFGALQNCPTGTDYVFIHDGVRPFITIDFLDELYRAVQVYQAVVPGAPLKNTIKEVADGQIVSTLERGRLAQVFTPQVFNYSLLVQAYNKAYEDGFFSTDDASVVEHFGHPVQIVPSGELNIKITDETDWLLARLIVQNSL